MEIGPIFRALLRNRTRFVLIALEVALTLAIVVNCVHLALELRATMTRPSGMDEEHLLVVEVHPFAASFKDEGYTQAQAREDLRLLRSLPGARAVTRISQVPLSGAGSATGRKAEGSELDTIAAPYFTVGDDALETLGVELVAGRGFEAEDFLTEESSPVIVSQAMAERLFPDGDALGRRLTDRDEQSANLVVGIVRHMTNSWPESSVADRTVLFPGEPGDGELYRFLVRAEPAAIDRLYTGIEEALAERNEGRTISVQTLAEVRAETFRSSTAIVRLLGAVIFLLVFVTALGIVGVTSFSVTQRTHQIGTRRALGATREAILRYFLVESLVVAGTGLVVGVGLSYALSYALFHLADASRLGWELIAYGVGFFLLLAPAAALWPALRGARVPPVVATRAV